MGNEGVRIEIGERSMHGGSGVHIGALAGVCAEAGKGSCCIGSKERRVRLGFFSFHFEQMVFFLQSNRGWKGIGEMEKALQY